MTDLTTVLDLADLSVVRSEGVIGAEFRDPLADVVRRVRRRNGFVGETLVVAIAGGTGSGKSSLINALVGTPVAEVGIVRPTTGQALAVYPRDVAADLTPVLDDLGVSERVASDTFTSMVLVDLPDFDSTAEAHRAIVEEVLPRVDAIVWVFDPEKYADAVVHTEFLAGLVPYRDQFLFVLNQVDRLGSSADRVLEHLAELLRGEGFENADPSATIAHGESIDVGELRSGLERRLDLKRTVVGKLATDLGIAANDGWRRAREEGLAHADGSDQRNDAALSAATFVTLGVAAREVAERMKGEW